MVEVTSEPHSIVVKLQGGVGSLQFDFGDSPNLICKGTIAAFKGTTSRITTSCVVRGREENTVALVASWGAMCLHTAPTEMHFPPKGRTFCNTSLCSPAPLMVTSYLYFVQALFVLYPLLAGVLLLLASYRLLLPLELALVFPLKRKGRCSKVE